MNASEKTCHFFKHLAYAGKKDSFIKTSYGK